MSLSKAHLPLAILFAAAIGTTVSGSQFVEDFSTMPVGSCYPDGTVIGAWRFVFNGYGCSGFTSVSSNTMLVEQPEASLLPDETHSALVLGPSMSGDVTVNVSMVTTRQLRATAPNPWEVGWLLWNYRDNTHFYYFIPKPNGWELGKEDPAYPGSQRFLASGSSPSFPIGPWYRVRVEQASQTIRVLVNGIAIVTFTDRERPYSSGSIGLYTEDAESYFDDVVVSTSTTTTKGKK
jgi:Domain of Unknown Function (DUF1080)